MNHKLMSATIAATITMSLGCGTLVTLSDNKSFPNQIYAGTRAMLFGRGCTQIDVPFSIVADTIVLPYTIPRTVYNYTHVDTLFYEYDLKRLRLARFGPSVLVIYSSTDNNSKIFWPNLLRLADQKRTHYVGFYVYSLDRGKKDAANLVSRYELPPFSLYWVNEWDEGRLEFELESLGVSVQEPIVLPVVAVFDFKGRLLNQWYGIRDTAEVEKALKYTVPTGGT